MTVAAPNPTSALHEAARTYAANGILIFPCLPRGKRPLTANGFHDAICDPDQIDTWWNEHPDANIGIPLGANGKFVLDVDGPDGAATLTDLEHTYDQLPASYQVITGRAEGSGRHHVYNQPSGEPIRNRKIGDHLETRGDGGYVIAPPSIHPSGRPYLAHGRWDQIVDAPGWLIHLARQPRPAPTTVDSTTNIADARLQGLAGKVAMAAEGNRNDVLNWAAYTAGQAAAAGNLDADTVTQVLTEAARRAGLDDREIAATIASGLSAGALHPEPQQTLGGAASAPDPTVLPPPTAQPDDWADQIRERARSGVDFLTATRGPIPPVWGEDDQVLWAEGEGLLIAGGPGVGKTTLAQQVVAGLLGHPRHQQVIGHRVHGARRVLYLALDRPRQIGRALGRLLDPEADIEDLAGLTVWDEPLPFRPDQQRDGLTLFARALDAQVVVIDSLYDLSPGIVKPEVAGEVVAGIKLAVNAGIDVVAIHHARKQPTQGRNAPSLDELYGGMQLGAGFGSVLWLKGKAGETTVSMLHLKQPGETVGPYTLRHDHQAGTTDIEAGVDLLAAAIAKGSIDVPTAAVLMAEDPNPDRAAKERARRRLEQLEKAGKLEVVQSGDGVLKVWAPCGDQVTVLDPKGL